MQAKSKCTNCKRTILAYDSIEDYFYFDVIPVCAPILFMFMTFRHLAYGQNFI